jgi:hypothetical protein
VLAPLEKGLKLSADKLTPFNLQPLELQNFVRTQDEETHEGLDSKFKTIFTIALTVVYFYFIAGGAILKDNPRLYPWYWVIGVPLILFGLALGVILASNKRPVILRLVAQIFSLLLILTIGIGLPTLAVYFFGGGRGFLGGEPTLALLGRALQLIFIATASLLPALLYFLFDRQQLGTLRERFEQQIFRLDPNVASLIEVRAKYGRQLAEIYGPDMTTDEGRLIRATRWPILVATLVITLGWILTLLPAGGGLVISQPSEILNLFLPQRTAVIFGFLGVYFFGLNTISHRYVRADLKPKAYSSITVRVFIVVILAWVIGLPVKDENPYELMLVFVIGIFPESGLTLIRESIRKGTGLGKFIPYTREKHPLTNLEEIDVYDRARLLDEGGDKRREPGTPRSDRPHAGDAHPGAPPGGLDRPGHLVLTFNGLRREEKGRQGCGREGGAYPARVAAEVRHSHRHRPDKSVRRREGAAV